MEKSLLSIQSHVSHGYVGNRAASFPLQCLGWDVDMINSVNFSNHTGYGHTKGNAITKSDMKNLFSGLAQIQQLLSYDAILSGYIPNQELIEVVVDEVKKIKVDSQVLYLLDPVMGDQNYLYVDQSCVSQYQKAVHLGVVDIITPNQFELELLCGFSIKNTADLVSALNYLHHECNINYVVVTSLNSDFPLFEQPNENVIHCVASSRDDDDHFHVFEIPVIHTYFTGVGDLFSALLLHKLYTHLSTESSEPLIPSVNQALSILSNVLHLTHTLGLKLYCRAMKIPYDPTIDVVGTINDGDTMKYFELRLIHAREYFNSDTEHFKPILVKKI